MDGIINIRVNGYSLTKDHNCAGAQHESNSTKLRIEFGKDWDGFTKKVTFWNALGKKPTAGVLTPATAEDILENARVLLVPIPGEAMTEAGMITFAIDGFKTGVLKRSVEDKLKVLPSRKEDNPDNAKEPAADQVTQIMSQIEGMRGDIQEAYQSAKDAEASATAAGKSEQNASEYSYYCENATQRAVNAAEQAGENANKAEAAVGKTSYIGENGNWFEWNSKWGQFVDTGIRAQAGSVVYVGTEPPEEANVWVNPELDYDGVLFTGDDIGSEESDTVRLVVNRAGGKKVLLPAGVSYSLEGDDDCNVYTIAFENDPVTLFPVGVGFENGDWQDFRCGRDYTVVIKADDYSSKIVGIEILSIDENVVTITKDNEQLKNVTLKAEVKNGSIGYDQLSPFIGADITNMQSSLNQNVVPKLVALSGNVSLLTTDLAGLRTQLNQEAHFRGYKMTNASIIAMESTPNDFAYSAESGTKWVYDEASGWQDTGVPVPDQFTPASNATPLVNGEASAGESEEYARGDHRHPTDTSRASVADLEALKSTIVEGLNTIIAMQNNLIGGGS